MTREVFDNEMAAHVWAQGRQNRGRSANGNFFFEGPALYSYGRHYLAAFRLDLGEDRAPVALVNGDSYSISTGRHVSYARRAVAYDYCEIPGLTSLAEALEMTRPEQRARKDAYGRQRQADARAVFAKYLAARALELSDKAGAVLAELAGARPAKAAEAFQIAKRAAQRAKDKAAKAEAKAAHEAAKADARYWSERPFDLIRADFRRNPDSAHWSAIRNKTMLAAMQKARALGWNAKADQIKAARRLVAELLADAGRAYQAARARDNVRAHIQIARHLLRQFRTTGRLATTTTQVERALNLAAAALESARPAGLRAFGFDPAASAAKARALIPEALRQVRLTCRANARDQTRARVRALRDAMRPDADESTLRAGWSVARAFRDESTYGRIDPAARLAGWTPEKIAAGVKDFAAMFDARLEAQEAQTLADWRAGVPGARRPRRAASGHARVRALGVERDAAGAITGGTLETDQGAHVPLVHAVRVFQFVARCRARGVDWRARAGHPQEIRVGHFAVDQISAQGDFRAGCHSFQWAEIAALADALGVTMAESEGVQA